MIKALLIDVDDTLLDFGKCAEASIRRMFADMNLCFSNDVVTAFHFINDGLWREIEKGTLSREDLFAVRWNKIYARLGISADGKRSEELFRMYLGESAEKIDGADEILQYLSKKYILAVASNGAYEEQMNRLKKAGLSDYFSKVFVSERLGVSKPDVSFFDLCAENLGLRKDEIMMIGDSVTADIEGAVNAGIKTCLFDKKGKKSSVLANYRVERLSDIRQYL